MEISRYEMNQQVRKILIQHGVNLVLIDYSYIGGTVYLYGTLQKDSRDEFTSMGLETLAFDIKKLRNVSDIQFDLENWAVNRNLGSWNFTRRTQRTSRFSSRTPYRQGAASSDKTVEIKNFEKLSDVLNDITKKEEDTDKKD